MAPPLLRPLLRLALGVLLPAALAVACRSGGIDITACDEPCLDCQDPCDPCPEGECVPLPALGWEGPALLWTGLETDAPACPEQAPATVYEGHDGLVIGSGCLPCMCEPALCALPAEVAVSDEACAPGTGVSGQALSVPDGWTGACAVQAGIPVAAGGTLRMAPTTAGPCAPVLGPVPTSGSFQWATFARACQSAEVGPACLDRAQRCAARSGGGFRQCVFKDGDEPRCPAGYPERRVFYRGTKGDLDCSPCTCGPPQGGECAANLVTSSDGSCSSGLVSGFALLDEPKCWDATQSGEVRGLSASWVVNEPGGCEPGGGQPQGVVEPDGPSTFCCMP